MLKLAMGGGRGVRILGIDPGSMVVGFGCLELAVRPSAAVGGRTPLALAAANVVRDAAHGCRARYVDAGVLRLGGRKVPVEDRLHRLQVELTALLERLKADELALEEAFYGTNVGTALRIGESRGVILAAARGHGLGVYQFAPARIKRAVTGNGVASKEMVADMVCRQLAMRRAPSPRDATDALAAAICRAEQRVDPLGA